MSHHRFSKLTIPYRTNTPLRIRIGYVCNMYRIVFGDSGFLELVGNTASRENRIPASRHKFSELMKITSCRVRIGRICQDTYLHLSRIPYRISTLRIRIVNVSHMTLIRLSPHRCWKPTATVSHVSREYFRLVSREKSRKIAKLVKTKDKSKGVSESRKDRDRQRNVGDQRERGEGKLRKAETERSRGQVVCIRV